MTTSSIRGSYIISDKISVKFDQVNVLSSIQLSLLCKRLQFLSFLEVEEALKNNAVLYCSFTFKKLRSHDTQKKPNICNFSHTDFDLFC